MTHEERISHFLTAVEPQAFPIQVNPESIALIQGLSKREYFAIHALAALDIGGSNPEKSAAWAVRYADALLKELRQSPSKVTKLTNPQSPEKLDG